MERVFYPLFSWACVRLFCNPGATWFLSFEKKQLFSIEDPPSKENPYEDIELEKSCLGSKCVSPASSSPVPDTPTKVLEWQYSTINKVDLIDVILY